MIEQIITSSILIVAVLILSGLMEQKIHPCIKYALWLLVAVKLLVPVPEFESEFSVMNVVAQVEEADVQNVRDTSVNHAASSDMGVQNEQVAAETEGSQNTENVVAPSAIAAGKSTKKADIEGIDIQGIDAEGVDSEGVDAEGMDAEGMDAEHRSPVDGFTILRILWGVGMVLCAGVFVRSNLRFGRALKRGRRLVGCFRGRLDVYQVSGIASPCLFGAFKPSIYLQEECELSEEQKEYVCTHEYIHYRHGDSIWAMVRCMCVIVYWFNPLVWVAARASMRDSELACDAGTVKLIGQNHKLEYGRTLVELAGDRTTNTSVISVLGCSTGVTGGAREMKKRIQMIAKQPVTKVFSLIVMLMACACIVGCTFGNAVSEGVSSKEHAMEGEAVGNASNAALDAAMDAAVKAAIEEEQALQMEVTVLSNSKELTYKETILYEKPLYDDNKVCIMVAPSMLGVRDSLNYYYVPTNEEKEWIVERLKVLNLAGEPYAKRWKGMKETGWKLFYDGWRFRVFEGGYLYSTYDDSTMECLVRDEELCDYIQKLLQEKLDYQPFDPANIKDIVSAKLDVCSIFTDWEFRSQTITDEETLKSLEELLSEAEYFPGGAECCNQFGCLELTLAGGEVVRLSMAADSCDNFGINGIYYDYHPAPGGDNSIFYQYFDGIMEDTADMQRHISISNIYRPGEISDAMELVEETLPEQFAGCTLKEITYYENFSNKYADKWAMQYKADQAIVLTSDIEVPATNEGGKWSLGGIYYDFEWILTRNDGEEWMLQTWSY